MTMMTMMMMMITMTMTMMMWMKKAKSCRETDDGFTHKAVDVVIGVNHRHPIWMIVH